MLSVAPHVREYNERLNRIITLRDKISLLESQIFIMNIKHQDTSEARLETETLKQYLYALENHHIMNSSGVLH